jgi:hypothetical protein
MMRNGSSSPSPLLRKALGRVLLLQRLCLIVGSKTIEYLYSTAQIIDFVAVDESEEGMNHEKTTSPRGGATSVTRDNELFGPLLWRRFVVAIRKGRTLFASSESSDVVVDSRSKNHVVTNPRGHIVGQREQYRRWWHFLCRAPC